MATVETFETTLKDVVGAKRLSASKMTSLTEIALKCMENDTKLVSILYRTHKALPPSAKTSSLYVFDALSRAARNQVTKHNLTGDIYSEKGNSATFLLKIEGILDSLFQDLATSGTQELKEKAKKILDIWVKSSTFPSAVLARLSKLLMGAAEKEPDKVVSTSVLRNHQSPPTSTTPPGPPPTVPPTTTPALPTNGPSVDAVQSTLFALLSQAANAVASNGQTPPNSATLSAPAPVLDANQLALFQQLTQTAKLGSAFPTQQPIPLPVSLVPSSSTKPVPVPPVGGPSQPPPYRDDHYGSGRRESHYDRQAGPERGRDRDDYYDARRDRGRGGFRGGSRGRARGRWDDRDRHKDRNRDRDWAPAAPYKGRRSRSRSPPNRPSGPRGARPHSPPRRPSVAHSEGRHAAGPSADKDEFGRDLRAESPKESTESHSASHRSLSPPASAPAPNPVPTYTGAQSPPPAQPMPGNVATQSSTSPPPPPALAAQSLSLETFSPATFDPSSPEAWAALGQAWAGSNGYLPSQEELMSFAMGSGIIPGISLNSNFGTPAAGPWQGDGNWAMTDVPAQAGGMNVGHGYGNGRAVEYAGEQAYEQQSLGGGLGRFGAEGMAGYGSDPAWAGAADEVDSYAVPMDQEKGGGEAAMSSGGLPGRMERVGDKWVFVRRETSVV